jgi:two-component system nitrate/nitrite response regulator NarL
MGNNPMRILVADDHSLFRDGIVSLLEAAGFEVVGQVGDGREALTETRRLNPDVVLLDISMPEMNGLEALKLLREESPDIHVVMLTVSEDDSDLLEAIQAGASGYLLKSLSAEAFIELLKGLERDEAAISSQTTARLIKSIGTQTASKHEPFEKLTEREVGLLRLVADGLSNRAIAQELSISENTVKYHMKNIFQKLNAQNRTEAVTLAMQSGILGAQITQNDT